MFLSPRFDVIEFRATKLFSSFLASTHFIYIIYMVAENIASLGEKKRKKKDWADEEP